MESASRWALSLGLDPARLWIKRDDLTGLGGGGNKTRKLMVSIRAATAAGATDLVTTGAPQSNHARLTAAAGARAGLPVTLVLEGRDPSTARGNLLLDTLFGATIIWCKDRDLSIVEDEVVRAMRNDGAKPYTIPFGGSSAETAVAYRDAAREIVTQVRSVDHVVVAVGSGGTMAGLVAELGPDRVLGIDTGAVPDPADRVAHMVQAMGQPDPTAALRLDQSQIGPGYATLTDGARAAMASLARSEGLVLDPTYTARAGAGLIKAVAEGQIAHTDTTVFLHTGGLPGLFGHREL